MVTVDIFDAVWLVLGCLVGGGLVAALQIKKHQSRESANALQIQLLTQQIETSQLQFDSQIDQLSDSLQQKESKLVLLEKQLDNANKDAYQLSQIIAQRDELKSELNTLTSAHNQLQSQHLAQAASFEEIQKAHSEKVKLLEASENRLQEQFENLANKIFEQKSESFTKQNKMGLESLLTPLKDQIEGFKRQINDQYVKEGQERASLKTEILSLKELNQQITSEAAALTLALKGDNKQQGNWGEVVLERILKESGLREGHEFDTQVSMRSEAGKLQQPDVVVHLPNDKDVIIDSKVSLSAYEKYFNSDDELVKHQCLKDHVTSIKQHIKGLGAKDYQDLPGVKTLDYVLMFIPVEPAFLIAIETDPQLVTMALNNNIMLVSPTNLLVALRTINNIWQYEYQNQNAQKIAQHGAKLYDKFAGFITDMEKIGKSIETTQKHFDGAFNKLSQGRGNILRQVEQFKDLGVQPSKKLPESLTNQHEED